jgi:excisionase family DNA binding protein
MSIRHDTTEASAPQLLRVPDLARELDISRSLAWALVRSGAIESVRIGQRCRRVPRAALERAVRDGIPARVAEEAS